MANTWKLNKPDSRAFIESLFDSPNPNRALKDAVNRFKTPLHDIMSFVRTKHPTLLFHLEEPMNDHGVWTLDIDRGDRYVCVQWSTAGSFGISDITGSKTDEKIFQTGSDIICQTTDDVRRCIDRFFGTSD